MCISELRPHHGLCTLFFVGKGYSSDFTENMAEFIERLKQKGQRITLTAGEDCICAACPHNNNGCDCSEKVREYDSKVLELCGLNAGETLSAESLYDLIRKNILGRKKLGDVCGSCQWFGLCSEMLEK